mgnify:CR=1 FL=1
MHKTKGHPGVVPENPYACTSMIGVKVTAEMRRALRRHAAEKDASVSAVVKAAIEGYLAQHRTQA